jgi:hypothetical protein
MFRPLSFTLRLGSLVFLLCCAMAVHGQLGNIQGRLMLDQNLIADEMVVLKTLEGRICNGTMTNEKGYFYFDEILPGTYTLVGKFGDFEAEVECVVNPGEVVHVSLNCKKKSLFKWIPDAGPHQKKQTPVFT